jgi:hypothetical protein
MKRKRGAVKSVIRTQHKPELAAHWSWILPEFFWNANDIINLKLVCQEWSKVTWWQNMKQVLDFDGEDNLSSLKPKMEHWFRNVRILHLTVRLYFTEGDEQVWEARERIYNKYCAAVMCPTKVRYLKLCYIFIDDEPDDDGIPYCPGTLDLSALTDCKFLDVDKCSFLMIWPPNVVTVFCLNSFAFILPQYETPLIALHELHLGDTDLGQTEDFDKAGTYFPSLQRMIFHVDSEEHVCIVNRCFNTVEGCQNKNCSRAICHKKATHRPRFRSERLLKFEQISFVDIQGEVRKLDLRYEHDR